jgi:glycosyltransferase involved in cell wall biosynthesis
MKILFLSPVAQLGGAERILLDLIASVREVLPAASSMHLIALADGPLIGAANQFGVEVHVVPLPARLANLGDSALRNGGTRAGLAVRSALAVPSLLGFTRELKRKLATINPDIIHSNGIKTHVLSRLVASAAPSAKIIWHIHDLLGDRPLLGTVLRRFASRVSCAVAISNAVAVDLQAALPNTPVQTVLNGIDIDHFSPGGARTAELDRRAGFAHHDTVIRVGLIATYARWKGQDVFLEAAAEALRASPRPEIRFYVIGGPIYATAGSQFSRAELSDRVRTLGIADHVGFIDFQIDPRDAYRALDIVVHASTRPEPFGRTIAEAMACGRAVIVTRGGGASELFTHDHDAIGVEPSQPAALRDAILRLARDPALRARLGGHARKTASEKFDRRRLGSQMLAIYQSSERT